MIKVKEELRVASLGNGSMGFVLTDSGQGVTIPEFLETCGDDRTLGGFADVLKEFRRIESKGALPQALASSAVAAVGATMCYLNRQPYGIVTVVAGAVGMATAFFRKHAMMFRDCVGNEVDLFLGIVYIAGTRREQYLHFSSVSGEGGSGF